MKTRKVRMGTEQHEQDSDPRPFRLRLLQRLTEADVDIAALWRVLDGTPEYSRLATLLNSACFTEPEELQRLGYPMQAVQEARRAAAATVESSFRDIVALAKRHQPPRPEAEESPPTENESSETAEPVDSEAHAPSNPAVSSPDEKPSLMDSFEEMT